MGAFMLRGLWRAEPTQRLIVMPAQTVELRQPQEPEEIPLEHAPGPPVSAPDFPKESADKSELWYYGELYLGWEALADVNLDEYSSNELRSWLRQDQKLYDWGDGLVYDELGYLESEE